MAVREISELKEDIRQLKKQTGSALFAHFYQDPDIIEVSDGFGDCFDILRGVRECGADRVIICGASYIAETVELFFPEKEVILAHTGSRCPAAGQIYPGRVRIYKEEHPDAIAVCTVCSTNSMKKECDICVTAHTAVDVIRALRENDVFFVGDCNLGSYISQQLPSKNVEILPGSCPVLSFTELRDVELSREKWPGALVTANSSCIPQVRAAADMVGSTADIMRYCAVVEQDVIVIDEVNVAKRLRRIHPGRRFSQPAKEKLVCSCMEIINLSLVERVLKGEFGLRVTTDSHERDDARRSVEAALRLISSAGGDMIGVV